MNNNKLFTSFNDFNTYSKVFENEESSSNVDESIIEKLVDLVGSEEEVEEAAKEAFEELQKSFERNEVEADEAQSAENLAISALIVKLVEQGKLGPEEADDFIKDIM